MSARYNFEVGRWLRSLRESMPGSGKGGTLTQVEAVQLIRQRTKAILGEEVPVSPQELSRLEKGQVEYPAAETLCAVALGYRVDIMDILTRYGYYPKDHQEETDARLEEMTRQFQHLSEYSRNKVIDTLEWLLTSAIQIDRREGDGRAEEVSAPKRSRKRGA